MSYDHDAPMPGVSPVRAQQMLWVLWVLDPYLEDWGGPTDGRFREMFRWLSINTRIAGEMVFEDREKK